MRTEECQRQRGKTDPEARGPGRFKKYSIEI
jgi:hypothetical protein